MEIKIDNLELTASNRVVGSIYVDLAGQCFPELNWSDYVDAILNMWSSQLISFLLYPEKPIQFPFMDGPFSIEVTRKSQDDVVLLFIHQDKAMTTFITNLKTLKESICTVLEVFVESCKNNGWSNSDISIIRNNSWLLNQGS